ncbi:OsmC family protein [Pricia sp. S334]|uniref:OsmC family protein n=1 Tax=Pricia mediterranea TaxID=3076079 RepID=A0ABU3L9X9_9FLAO|nr:OsmC family protein [Pricia sp. S334]MDT7830540.1 OsmC family protein [Pricia sp. S334]
MNFTRNASANWEGSIKEGKGNITTGSGALDKAKYAFGTRFKDEKGTNPEELIGAAHAGCYTMQLSGLLGENDYTPNDLHTDAKVTFEDGEITKIALSVSGKVPNIKEDEFVELAEKAKKICPVSKLLDTNITLEAKLEA